MYRNKNEWLKLMINLFFDPCQLNFQNRQGNDDDQLRRVELNVANKNFSVFILSTSTVIYLDVFSFSIPFFCQLNTDLFRGRKRRQNPFIYHFRQARPTIPCLASSSILFFLIFPVIIF